MMTDMNLCNKYWSCFVLLILSGAKGGDGFLLTPVEVSEANMPMSKRQPIRLLAGTSAAAIIDEKDVDRPTTSSTTKAIDDNGNDHTTEMKKRPLPFLSEPPKSAPTSEHDHRNTPQIRFDASVFKAGAQARRFFFGSSSSCHPSRHKNNRSRTDSESLTARRNANSNIDKDDDEMLFFLVDVENVRGKAGFLYSHEEILHAMFHWTLRCCQGVEEARVCVVLVVDHGAETSSFQILHNDNSTNEKTSTRSSSSTTGANPQHDPNQVMAIVFSGNHAKADDVIVHDVKTIFTELSRHFTVDQHQDTSPRVMVVTGDRGLIQRCRRVSKTKRTTKAKQKQQRLSILPPEQLLGDLEAILDLVPLVRPAEALISDKVADDTISSSIGEDSTALSMMEEILDREIQLGAQLLEAETALRTFSSTNKRKRSSGKNNKRLRRLQKQVHSLRTRLYNGKHQYMVGNDKSILQQVTGILHNDHHCQGDQALQNKLLRKWNESKLAARRQKQNSGLQVTTRKIKEETGDRVVLAEYLRRRLVQRVGQLQPAEEGKSNDDSTCIADESSSSSLLQHDLLPYTVSEMRTYYTSSSSNVNTSIPIVSLTTTNRVEEEEKHLKEQHRQRQRQATKDSVSPLANPTVVSQTDSFHLLPHHRKSLRLVVVSDTHGYEQELTATLSLPKGGVLIHCGDFASDHLPSVEQRTQALKKFDSWLAEQPHPVKIVVRGNHDPRTWTPSSVSESVTIYATSPTTLYLGGDVGADCDDNCKNASLDALFTMTIVPHMVGGDSAYSNRMIKNAILSPPGRQGKGAHVPRSGCDVFVTHVPPRDVLDRVGASGMVNNGAHAGSHRLRKAISRLGSQGGGGQTPLLWLCGHIHESRGMLRHKFGDKKKKGTDDEKETLVINAANANPGIAKRIEHGPVVLDLVATQPSSVDDDNAIVSKPKLFEKKVNVVTMENKFVYLNNNGQEAPSLRSASFSNSDSTKHTTVEDTGSNVKSIGQLLVAVDLGLRTGLCLFNDEGKVLKYQDLQFESADDLRRGAKALLREWEMSANSVKNAQQQQQQQQQLEEGPNAFSNTTNESDSKTNDGSSSEHVPGEKKTQWKITHFAVEGSDVQLREVWRELVASWAGASLLIVRPEEWRVDLLSHKEQQSGALAKEASRLIARQVVADFGVLNGLHEGKFQTDVAEAVLLGYHVVRRLGWMKGENDREPAVRRYTNGSVIVPSAKQ